MRTTTRKFRTNRKLFRHTISLYDATRTNYGMRQQGMTSWSERREKWKTKLETIRRKALQTFVCCECVLFSSNIRWMPFLVDGGNRVSLHRALSTTLNQTPPIPPFFVITHIHYVHAYTWCRTCENCTEKNTTTSDSES